MKLYEFMNRLDEIPKTHVESLGDKILIRNCVDDRLYDIDEISRLLLNGEKIVIIDIKPVEP